MKRRGKVIRCDQCNLATIYGRVCHETGCPHAKSRWDGKLEEWVRQYTCRECGDMVDVGQELSHGSECWTEEEA